MNDRPLRVGLFSPALPDSGVSNGIVTYVRIMRHALTALGHRVMVVTGAEMLLPDDTIVPFAPYNPIKGRIMGLIERRHGDDGLGADLRLLVLKVFLGAKRASSLDVYEIEESFGWAGRLAGRGTAIVERLHGPHVYGRDAVEPAEVAARGNLREVAEGRSLTKVDAITCPSGRLLKATLDHYRVAPAIAEVIPNPIETAAPADCWSIDRCDPEQILCVGRFDMRKGADIVLLAFQRALTRAPRLRLVMAGPDVGLLQPDGSLVHFEAFVRDRIAPEVRDRIAFLGPQDAGRIAELRLASGFAVVGSRFENFAYSIAEQMAVGAPSLVSDSFGNGEMIQDGVTGRVVPVGDVDAMADAIVAMTADPARLAEMGRQSYQRCTEWLSPDRVARDTVALYRRAIANM